MILERSEIREEANRLQRSIKEGMEQLDNLQTECQHNDFKIVPAEDTNRIVKKCADCDAQIGFPSDDELEQSGYK